jgi:hypothetical protein
MSAAAMGDGIAVFGLDWFIIVVLAGAFSNVLVLDRIRVCQAGFQYLDFRESLPRLDHPELVPADDNSTTGGTGWPCP